MYMRGMVLGLAALLAGCAATDTTETGDAAISEPVEAAVTTGAPSTTAVVSTTTSTTTTISVPETSTTTTSPSVHPITADTLADSILAMASSEELRIVLVQSTSDVIESDRPDIKETFESATRIEIGRIGDDYYSLTNSTLFGGYDLWSRDGVVIMQLQEQEPVRFVDSATREAATEDLRVLAETVRESSVEVIDESHRLAIVRLTCGDGADLEASGTVRMWCSESSTVHLSVRLDDGFIEASEVVGPLALYPGLVLQTHAHVLYSTEDVVLDPNAPFDSADAAPLACVAATIGLDIDDHEGLADHASKATTEGNRELFQGCGFQVWPPGEDLHS